MKKIIMLLLIISGVIQGANIAGGKAYLSNGILSIKDTGGATETNIDISDQNGFYLEFYVNQEDSPAEVAMGLRYNTFEEKSSGDSVAYVTTIYGVGRFVWDIPLLKPYFQIKAGYPYAIDGTYIEEYQNSSNTGYNDMTGDVYFSAGIGLQLLFADASINYDLNSFQLKSSVNGEKDVVESHVSLNVGFIF